MVPSSEFAIPDDLPMVEMIDEDSALLETQKTDPAPPPLPQGTRINRSKLVPPLANTSRVDTTSNPYAPPYAASKCSLLDAKENLALGMPTSYEEVPWFRKSGTLTTFMLIGLVIPPFLWAACGLCLTGEVYNNQSQEDGTLSRWSPANKGAALIILLIHTIGIVSRFS